MGSPQSLNGSKTLTRTAPGCPDQPHHRLHDSFADITHNLRDRVRLFINENFPHIVVLNLV